MENLRDRAVAGPEGWPGVSVGSGEGDKAAKVKRGR